VYWTPIDILEIVLSHPQALDKAAHDIGIEVVHKVMGHSKDGLIKTHVTLNAIGKRYLRMDTSGPKYLHRANGVCFHGYEAFIGRMFQLAPEARVMSRMTSVAGSRWMTKDNFVRMADTIGNADNYRNTCSCGMS